MTDLIRFGTEQYRYKKQQEKREKKEAEEYNISWGCERISEKGNKTLSYLAIALMGIPIIFAIIWWSYSIETGDLGTFLGGGSILLYILVPVFIGGFILVIVYAIIRSSCRKKEKKVTD
jgi:hypothetical protein